MRLVYPVIISILWLSGCSSITAPDISGLQSTELSQLNQSKGNYYGSGRIFFKNPDAKHSGELEIQVAAESELRLSIYTPLVGSLIYELRANTEKFLLLNFQENNYVLEANTSKVRQTWLGMDLSLTELKWLLLGRLPENDKSWQRQVLPAGELLLIQGTVEIRLEFNSAGQIVSMIKSLNGVQEYRAQIPLYQKHAGILLPRKISIVDYTGNNQWLMLISEILAPSKMKNLEYSQPAGMQRLFRNQ